MAIDFTLSESQRDIQESARLFAKRFLTKVGSEVDRIADPWEAFLSTREAYGFAPVYSDGWERVESC